MIPHELEPFQDVLSEEAVCGVAHGVQLCDFEVRRDLSYPGTVVEFCKRCGKRIAFNEAKHGRTDNERYRKAHIRDFVQRSGRTARLFKMIYG